MKQNNIQKITKYRPAKHKEINIGIEPVRRDIRKSSTDRNEI